MRCHLSLPHVVLALVLLVFVMGATLVLVLTPAWEANDESDHTRNVEMLAGGAWYSLDACGGLAAHQPPLYYLGLAAYQRAIGLDIERPDRQRDTWLACPPFSQGEFGNTADERLARLLRLPNVVLGALTVLLTYVAARRLSRDPWTPVVAAAIVVGVPKFVFLSGVINNDNLSNFLGAIFTILMLWLVTLDRAPLSRLWRVAAAIGAVFGLLVLTKLSTLPFALAIVLGMVLLRVSWRVRVQLLAVVGAAALAVCGWYLVRNQIVYGDVFARDASLSHLRSNFGLGGGPLARHGMVERMLIDVPRGVFKSFWYTSGWNQYYWSNPPYALLWVLLVLPLLGVVRGWRRAPREFRVAVLTLAAIAISALSTIWIVARDTTTFQARIAFMGLPAIACLAALGLERLRVPVALRFLGPLVGLAGTYIAIRHDVINAYAGR